MRARSVARLGVLVALDLMALGRIVHAHDATVAPAVPHSPEPIPVADRAAPEMNETGGEESITLKQPQTLVVRVGETASGGKKAGEGWELVLALIAVSGSFGGVWIGQRLGFNLAGDRLLLEKRIEHYERVFSLLRNLPKYPEPRPLSVSDILALSLELQAWYFDGAGLYMNTHVREAYFDLQDGIRLVLARSNKVRLPKELPPPEDVSDADLRDILDRRWGEVPTRIRHLAKMGDPTDERDVLNPPVLEHLRNLSSDLRTKMCGDLASRRSLGRKAPT